MAWRTTRIQHDARKILISTQVETVFVGGKQVGGVDLG